MYIFVFKMITYIGAKLEWLDTFLAEQLYLIIPICYRSGPIGSGTLATLLVDVKILSHHEPGCMTLTFRY